MDRERVVKKTFERKLEEEKEKEDHDWDNWKMLKRIYGR
jgi:hypothetical protein